jgi:hypothetical protein
VKIGTMACTPHIPWLYGCHDCTLSMWILHYGHLDLQSGHVDFEQWLGQDNPRRPIDLCIVWGLKRAEKAIKYVGSWEQIVLKLQSLPLGERNGLLYWSQLWQSGRTREMVMGTLSLGGSQNSELQRYLLAIMVGFEITLLHVGCC